MVQTEKAIENITQLDRYWGEYNAQGFRPVANIRYEEPENIQEIVIGASYTYNQMGMLTDHDGRKHLTISGDKIDITVESGKLVLRAGGWYLSGKPKSAALLYMTQHGELIDITASYDWTTYTFKWNDHIVQTGFHKMSNAAYGKLYSPRAPKPTSQWQYVPLIAHTRSYRPRDVNKVYGEPEASGFTQDMIDQLEDIYEVLESVINTGDYAEQINAIRELLDNA